MDSVSAPGIVAINAINTVMETHQEEKGDSWLSVSMDAHLYHAMKHLYHVEIPSTEDLSHALTRIAMILALLEIKKKGKNGNTKN